MALGLETGLELAVVLDDAVQHDRHRPVVAAGQRVRIPLGDARRAWPSECGRARWSPPSGRSSDAACFRFCEIADRAHVVQAVGLEQRDAGGVVAAVLQPLQTVDQQRLHLLGPTYPMIPHTLSLPPVAAAPTSRKTQKARLAGPSVRLGRLAELSWNESCDRTTERSRLLLVFGLDEHPDDAALCPTGGRGLGPFRPARALIRSISASSSSGSSWRARARSPWPADTAPSRPPPRPACGPRARRRAAARPRARRPVTWSRR